MSSITEAVTTTAPDIASFGAGGQMYMASMYTGFEIRRSKLINPLFAFTRNDSSPENAASLTNLDEARKIGSTMAFRAYRLGFRIVNFHATLPTLDEVNALKILLSGASITLTVGSNETKIAEFSGMDLMQPIDTVAAHSDASDNVACANVGGLGGGIGWIPLQIPIEIQPNCNVGGVVRFNNTKHYGVVTPATDSDPALYGFVLILQGLKVVKS